MPIGVRYLSSILAIVLSGSVSSSIQAPVCDNRHYASELRLKVDIDTTAGLDLKSDGLGSYVDGADRCIVGHQMLTGMPLLGFPALTTHRCSATTPHRTFSFDLGHPLGSAPSRGTIHVSEGDLVFIPAIAADGYVGLSDMRIGKTSKAQLFEIKDRGADLRLAFAPRWVKGCNPRNVPGPMAGTTEADLKRTSATTWELTLPAGSIGRLYDLDDTGAIIDKGLYRFQAHLTITSF